MGEQNKEANRFSNILTHSGRERKTYWVVYGVCEVKSKQDKNTVLFQVSHTRASAMKQE